MESKLKLRFLKSEDKMPDIGFCQSCEDATKAHEEYQAQMDEEQAKKDRKDNNDL